MSYGSPYYHRTLSNQEFTTNEYYRPRSRYPLPKCYSDSRYVKYDDRYDRFSGGQERYRLGYRYRGGQEANRNNCEVRQQDPCSRTNDDNDIDCCNFGQNYGQRRVGNRSSFNKQQEMDKYYRNQDRGGTNQDSCHQRNNDICDIYRKPNFEPSKPKHRKAPKRKSHCIPKCCMDYNGGNDDPSSCCTCEPCPFCLLRSFCTEVLKELADIKAKGGQLERLLYDPKAYQAQLSSEKMRYDEEEGELRKGPSRSGEEFSSESARRRHGRSDEDYSRDDNRSRRKGHSDDSMTRSRRRKGSDRSYDDRDGKRDRKGRKPMMDGRGDGKAKGKENGKVEKKKDKEPASAVEVAPDDVAQELEKARAKTERGKKKKEEDKARKALIERRVQQSTLMATKHWTVKKFTGAGKFCDCNLGCMQGGEGTMDKSENTARLVSSCLKLCSPVSMPMIFTINPRYCCPSFWCPPPPSECPAICC